MGEVVRFPATARLLRAYECVADNEFSLRMRDDPASGMWVIARAALVMMAGEVGAERAAARADEFASELRQHMGQPTAPSDDHPRPAA